LLCSTVIYKYLKNSRIVHINYVANWLNFYFFIALMLHSCSDRDLGLMVEAQSSKLKAQNLKLEA